ncbi:MAG: prepilin-type N-terminal cleavage/methylation domain-containing protein [Pseudomonadota bacterium]
MTPTARPARAAKGEGGAAGPIRPAARPGACRTGAGFTLLEVLVAFVILALVLAGAYAGIGQGAATQGEATRRLEALTIAENALARVGADLPFARATHRLDDGAWQVTLTVAPLRPAGPWQSLATAPWRLEVAVAPARAARGRGPGRTPGALTLATTRLGPAP